MKPAILAAGVVAAQARFFTNNTDSLLNLWRTFKQEHSRHYEEEEDNTRFQVFVENLKLIDERNARDTAIHGINKFSDMSQDEFRQKFLTGKRPASKEGRTFATDIPTYNGASTLVDWTGIYTTPVKNQGYCGSCWAFSATEQIESDAMRVLGVNYILSPEQITQCDNAAFGCGGGWTETAYGYVIKEGGLATESAYPYSSYLGVTGTCHSSSSNEVVGIKGFTTIQGEANMASYVQTTGPLSVCVDASSWSSYTSGIMSVCGQSVDHCVQAVGVDTGSNGYWKVRNSWGTSWGEGGYIQLAYGKNTCDITNDPTYTTGLFLD